MMKKIFFIIVSFYLLSFFSVNKILAACWTGSCTPQHEGDFKCSGSGIYYCDAGVWSLDHSCTYGCNDSCSCASAPAATATSVPITCSGVCRSTGCACGTATGNCQGDDECCKICPTSTPTPTPYCGNTGTSCTPGNGVTCCSGQYCRTSDYVCIPVPSNTPTSNPLTPSPTPVCDTTPGGCYPLFDDGCESTCDDCPVLPVGVSQPRTKSGDCYSSAACRNAEPIALGPCYTYENLEDTFFCGYCTGGEVNPTPTPFCQPFRCYNIPPENSVCPGFTAASCPSGLGNCDNCGGMDCALCPGSVPPTGPTPTPGCTENCLSDPRYLTTCRNQTFGICGNTIWCYGSLPNNCDCADNLCSSQTCVGSCGDNCIGLLNCAPTTLNRFEIRRWDSIWSFTDSNVNGRDITDAQNRLHICDPFLSDESPHPRSVVYVAWLNNLNGCGDIDANSVKMKWLGNNAEIAMTKLASYQSGPCAYTATVTYPTDTNIPSAQGFQITMKSISGGVTTDWTTVTPDLKLKVWNCQVPVSGTLYDGSAGQVCPDGGFTTLGNELGFSSLVFDSSSDDITATITSPSSYAGVNLIWAKSYLPLINGGIPAGNIDGNLQGSNRVTRVTDLGTGQRLCTSSQIDLWNGQVSPYSASPMAQIDFSFIADQEAWYQMVGAGVKSRILLQYGVPVTVLPETSKFLTLGDATRDNGLVSATNFLNINGNNLKDDMGSPNNWYIQQNTNDYDIYNYNYFYNNFYVKAGVGEILTDWSNAEPDNIYFVNGNLNINSNSPVVDPNTQTMIIIVRENITIQSNVTQLDGIYIADGSITAIGDNSAPLTINGMLYAGGSVGLYRSFSDKTVNNTTPAVKVNYSPGLIFNLPPEIMRILSGWKEE